MASNCTLETTLDDCLSLVVTFLSGIDIFRFYCASKSLKTRLLSGKVVKYLRFYHESAVMGFPTFAHQFRHLESFSLHVSDDPAFERKFRCHHILSLSPTLKKLDLRIRGAHSIWFTQYCPTGTPTNPQSNITVSNAYYEQTYDVRSAFPVLEELHLIGENPKLGIHVIPLFAPSLASLYIRGIMYQPFTLPLLSFPSLIELDLPQCNSMNTAIFGFLPHLEVLKLPGLAQECPEWYPPSLTTLWIGWNADNWTQKSLEALSPLPLLKTIHCGCPAVLSYLPASVTEICLNGTQNVHEEAVRQLPRNLRSFTCNTLSGTFEDFSFWPPQLESLEFQLEKPGFGSRDPRWAQLPKSLIGLRPRVSGSGSTHIHPSVLPPALKTFGVRCNELEGEMDYSFMKSLSHLAFHLFTPSYDTRISAPSTTSNPASIEANSIAHSLSSLSLLPTGFSPTLEEPFRLILPSRLQSLDWYSTDYMQSTVPANWRMKDRFASWLPDSLTSLQCDDSQDLTDLFLLDLPKSLKILGLQKRNRSLPSHFTSHGLKRLPSSLISLSIALNVDSDCSFVPFLPRGTEMLNIREIHTFPDSMIPHLPPGLNSLSLRHVVNGITDACLPYLPKSLKTLHLEHNKTLTPEALFSIAPCQFASIDLRVNPNFTKAKILQLAGPRVSIKTKKFVR